MFITKKARIKVIIRFVISAFMCIANTALAIFLCLTGNDEPLSVIIALAVSFFIISIGTFPLGYYSEGVSELYNIGRKTVYCELRPGEFISQYISRRNSPDNVISKPNFMVLSMALVAYDVMDDMEGAFLNTLDEMDSVANVRQKDIAKLLRADYLYEKGEIKEAERIFNDVRSRKLGLIARDTADRILKGERAMAYGDYATAEDYYRKELSRTFPALTTLEHLIFKFKFGLICSKTGRREEAEELFGFCSKFGGATSIRRKAEKLLNEMNSDKM